MGRRGIGRLSAFFILHSDFSLPPSRLADAVELLRIRGGADVEAGELERQGGRVGGDRTGAGTALAPNFSHW